MEETPTGNVLIGNWDALRSSSENEGQRRIRLIETYAGGIYSNDPGDGVPNAVSFAALLADAVIEATKTEVKKANVGIGDGALVFKEEGAKLSDSDIEEIREMARQNKAALDYLKDK